MKARLSMATRAFLLAFLPMCLVLAASFFTINRAVHENVKEGLRDSLNQTGSVISNTGPEYNRRYGQLLDVLGEGATLNALRQLLREASPNSKDRPRVRKDTEVELSELNAPLDYDFLGVADSVGRPIAGCFNKDEGFICFDPSIAGASKTPYCFTCHITPATNVIDMDGRHYIISYAPLREGKKILGSLTVGTRMSTRSLENFIHTAVLDVNDDNKVLLTTFYPEQVAEIEQQFQTRCGSAIDGCEIAVGGKRYLALQPEGVSLPGNSVLFIFQSIDEAANVFMHGFKGDFLLIGVCGGILMLLLSVTGSRSLSKPLRSLVAHLNESERTGKLSSDFATNSSAKEVNLLANALNRAGEAIRRSHQELQALAGRVISAKEEESRRLARELHDVFSQKLAVLGMEVAAFQKQLAPFSPPLSEKLGLMGDEIGRLAKDVHQLSRELHPSMLDHLGLTATLRAECGVFSKQHGIAVKFLTTNIPDSLPGEISLSLYRIVQESLWNVAKYAQAQEVRLTVSQMDGEFVLAVEDNGKGFDPEQIKGRGGLGLVSMEERARLVRGRFLIQSQPGMGTRVEVRIPVPRQEG